MDVSLQCLGELPASGRVQAAQVLIASIEDDLTMERRLLGELDIRVPGLSGVDPISTLQLAVILALAPPGPVRSSAAAPPRRLSI